MHQGTIICEYCGSSQVIKDRELGYAEVQRLSVETGEPVGAVKAYFILKCLSCGEDIFLEKYEAPNPMTFGQS